MPFDRSGDENQCSQPNVPFILIQRTGQFSHFRVFTPFGLEHGDEVEAEFLTDAEIRRRERENLFVVLQKTCWKIKGVDGAADLLGLKPTTLTSRIEKMGLKRPA